MWCFGLTDFINLLQLNARDICVFEKVVLLKSGEQLGTAVRLYLIVILMKMQLEIYLFFLKKELIMKTSIWFPVSQYSSTKI